MNHSKFALGKVVITSHAQNVLVKESVYQVLNQRYINCDWGDLTEADKKLNDYAVKNGERILAAYRDDNGTKFWIITEYDRSYTTILMPEDY